LRCSIPAIVVPRVARQYAFIALHDVIENRLTDGDSLVTGQPASVTTDFGHQLARLQVLEHDAAAIGIDPLEDHIHDSRQQLVDIERVAHRQSRAVHDLQVAACPRQPRRRRFVRRRGQDLAAFRLVHRVNDPRAVVFCIAGDDVDLVRQVLDAPFRDPRIQQQRPPELNLVAAG
jgi:hypothetical protein